METIKPFTSDIDHISAEIEAVTARCNRHKALRDLDGDHVLSRYRLGVLGTIETTATEEERRRLHAAEATEKTAAEALAARLDLTRKTGTVLALDALCADLQLDHVERTTLVLALIPAISRELASCFDGISSHGYGSDTVSVEALGNYLELDLGDRLNLRRYFGADAPLVKHCLVTVDLGFTSAPQDWPEATIKLTTKAFEAIIGAAR